MLVATLEIDAVEALLPHMPLHYTLLLNKAPKLRSKLVTRLFLEGTPRHIALAWSIVPVFGDGSGLVLSDIAVDVLVEFACRVASGRMSHAQFKHQVDAWRGHMTRTEFHRLYCRLLEDHQLPSQQRSWLMIHAKDDFAACTDSVIKVNLSSSSLLS